MNHHFTNTRMNGAGGGGGGWVRTLENLSPVGAGRGQPLA